MKGSLLFVFLFIFIQVSEAQTAHHDHGLSIDLDELNSQRIKPGATYKQSFSVKADQAASLHIQLRNRLSVISVLKSSVPLVAATTYGFLQRRRTSSPEQKQSQTDVAPYLAGGVIASSTSFALTPRGKRAYLELTYRNMVGVKLRTQGQWINIGKKTSVEIKSSEDGWVDVTVVAPDKRGLRIQQINFNSDINRGTDFRRKGDGIGTYGIDPGQPPVPEPLRNATKYPKSQGCTTFRAMWNRQNNDRHVEQAAFITDKGIWWLDDTNNDIDFSETGFASQYAGSPGSKHFTINGVTYYIQAIVHTHPLGDSSVWQDGVSSQDRALAQSFGVPIYSIADEGIGKGNASGSNAGIINYSYSQIFDCALDQNIVEELR